MDEECPTIRYAPFWQKLRVFRLRMLLSQKRVDKVLVTPTDPVHVVIVYSTYPTLDKRNCYMTRADFDYFFNELCGDLNQKDVIDWKKEGF